MSNKFPTYNLKAVVRETGLNPETLRAWERRYGLPMPGRTAGGHRLYTLRDIHILKWLIARQGEGLSISRAVELWFNLEQSGQDPLQAISPGKPISPAPESVLDSLRQDWIEACLRFDEQSAEQILAQAFAIAMPEVICAWVLQKGLSEIGEIWYRGEATVQQEHFTSALAMRHLHTLLAASPPPNRPGRILAFCPPEEEHEFALLLSAFLLRRRGWEVVYLGANVPLQRLESALKTTAPDMAISPAQTLPAAATLRDIADFLVSRGVPVAFGGGVFNAAPELKTRIPGHFLGEELSTVPQEVENLLSNQKPPPIPLAISPDYQQALALFLERQPLIEATASDLLKEHKIPQRFLNQAGMYFPRHLVAALSLGDIHLLGISIYWIQGYLSNAGLSPVLVNEYLAVYRLVVQEHLDDRGALIANWLASFINQIEK